MFSRLPINGSAPILVAVPVLLLGQPEQGRAEPMDSISLQELPWLC